MHIISEENKLYTGSKIYPTKDVKLICSPTVSTFIYYWTKDGEQLPNDERKYIINKNDHTLTVLNTDPSIDTGKSKFVLYKTIL